MDELKVYLKQRITFDITYDPMEAVRVEKWDWDTLLDLGDGEEIVVVEFSEPEEVRCICGHFEEEHTESGCAGCDAGGKSIEVIAHYYKADHRWTE